MIERQFPAARTTIARAAAHLAEARELLDEMAQTDLESCGGTALDIGALRRLGEARAKNLLRYWCEARGIQPLSAARITELLRQLRESRGGSRVSPVARGWELLRYREKLYLQPAAKAVGRDFSETWDGGNALPLLALGGVLKFKPEEGRGLSLAKLRAGAVTVRVRRGGERLRLDHRRPRRSLKNLFQERSVPTWHRERLPLLFCGEVLVSAPGIGDACEFRAAPGEAGLIVTWEPFGERDTSPKG